MRRFNLLIIVLATVICSSALATNWISKIADSSFWPYADSSDAGKEPGPTYRMTGAVLGTNMYSIGGYSLISGSTANFSYYNTLTNAWVSADGSDDINNLNGTWTSVGLTGYNNGNGNFSPVAGNGVGNVIDRSFGFGDGIYVFGGNVGGKMARYDIPSNSWSLVDSGGIAGNSGGALIGSHYYQIRAAGSVLDFNANTNTFNADIGILGLPNVSMYSPAGAIGGKLYVVDTYDAPVGFRGITYEIDPVTGIFAAKATIPTPVSQCGSVVFNGLLVIMGGRTSGGGGSACDLIQIYNPATDSWHVSTDTLPNLANQGVANRSGFLAEVVGNTLYVGNGYLASGSVGIDLWAYDIRQINGIPEPASILLVMAGVIPILHFLRRKP
jgi:hypothetical protein